MSTTRDDSDPDRNRGVDSHTIPAHELAKYRVENDPHGEQDIANYVHGQAPDETVQYIEYIRRDVVMGDAYDIWDVTTDLGRWWVITNLTNLYSQQHFPSLDYTLSFHIGLMMRLRSRPDGPDSHNPTPFEEVFRRQEQAKHRYDRAVEAEDYQAVGMQLRECLLSLISALRRRVQIGGSVERPQEANFISWSQVLAATLCPGTSDKQLRQHLTATAKQTWQLVSWLTHHRNANKTAAFIAINASDTVVGQFVHVLERNRGDKTQECPLCRSRDIRTHFDISIAPDGDYYATCGACEWNNHPSQE